MARRLDPKVLVKIVAVRNVQRIAAEGEAGRAAAALREKKDAARAGEDRLLDAERAWRACFGRDVIDLGTAALWSADAAAKRRILREANAAVADAGNVLETKTRAWHLATVRHDLAHAAHRKARRDVERRREEARLNDIADRTTLRSVIR
jgi:hypothetical protein